MGQRLAPRLAIAFMSKVEAPVMDLRPLLYYHRKSGDKIPRHCSEHSRIFASGRINHTLLSTPSSPD
ncbi:hypothetical protein KIN20_015344 [Parelaphostrongylus tenuis]|uniref:Uncharacterized protein n=1 Tax=Parelaphostrongylus tenuis TaxID=148309 RepID=A0AAD5MEQ9_PARTN|nr:hypothetical protein KIN20_015344 [Parelaphostrongylus tenuis]